MDEQVRNEDSAAALGWSPQMFGIDAFGDALTAAIRRFQRGFADLVEDGVCEGVTWRRLCLDLAPDDAPELPEAKLGDWLLVGGEKRPICWDRVVTPGEDGALALLKGFKVRKNRTVDKVITHWDVCLDAHACYMVLKGKGISTHVIIDWDGTIYQLVDLAHEAWHAGIGWINRSSMGIDFNNPVYPKYQSKLRARGQVERPVLEGWRINGWDPGTFFGPHQVQLDAYAALLAFAHTELGVPLDAPAAGSMTNRLRFLRKKQIGPGIYHHAEVDYPRKRKGGKVKRSGKWDTAGVPLRDAIAAATRL